MAGGDRFDHVGTERAEPLEHELTAVEGVKGLMVYAYERLLTDAMKGDATLFVREDAVDAAWAVVDDILDDATPVHAYKPGTWGPSETKRLAPIEGWHDPIVEG